MNSFKTARGFALAAICVGAACLAPTLAGAQVGRPVTMRNGATPQQLQPVWKTVTTTDGKCRITIPLNWDAPANPGGNNLIAHIQAGGGTLIVRTLNPSMWDHRVTLATNELSVIVKTSDPSATFTIIKQTPDMFVSKAICTQLVCGDNGQAHLVSLVKTATTMCWADLNYKNWSLAASAVPSPILSLETLAVVQ